jgi:hypothetical protein
LSLCERAECTELSPRAVVATKTTKGNRMLTTSKVWRNCARRNYMIALLARRRLFR